MKHTLKEWIFATRPWSLTASSMPALVAYSYIFFIQKDLGIDIHWWHGIFALLGAVVFQVGGNLLNDYFDYKYNVDRADTTYSSRTLVDNIFTSKSIFTFGMISLTIGSLLGLFLLYEAGLHLLWIGFLGFLGAYFYNRMKYIALGDFVIFVIYGFLIGFGVAYVMTSKLLWQVLLTTTPPGLLIVGILHANNTRDILNDKKANIRTQAMKMGLNTSKVYFYILTLGAYLGIVCLVLFQIIHPLTLIVLITLPMAIKCIKQMKAVTIDCLDTIKTLTESVAKLVMIFCLLYAIANFAAGLLFNA